MLPQRPVGISLALSLGSRSAGMPSGAGAALSAGLSPQLSAVALLPLLWAHSTTAGAAAAPSWVPHLAQGTMTNTSLIHPQGDPLHPLSEPQVAGPASSGCFPSLLLPLIDMI